MGRPPCCDKVGMKKGPWTPEEDIMLVSYVQEHGPANWRAVPTNTGLRRCSKSCRLRWTNYLRPGIKRGAFTDHEEKMIIQLQALLGNKWAAIASYLPQRTDNDIKNYWNTHLVKKLKKLSKPSSETHFPRSISQGKWERSLQADVNTARQALREAISGEENSCSLSEMILSNSDTKHSPSASSSYASSTENIARLLKDWVKNTPRSEDSKCSSSANQNSDSCSGDVLAEGDFSEVFDSLFGLDDQVFDQCSNSDDFSRSASPNVNPNGDTKPGPAGFGPLSVLEEWLLDDHGKDGYLENLSFDNDGNPILF